MGWGGGGDEAPGASESRGLTVNSMHYLWPH